MPEVREDRKTPHPTKCLHREGIDRYEPWVEYEDTEQKSGIACKEANCEKAWLTWSAASVWYGRKDVDVGAGGVRDGERWQRVR